MNPSEIPQVTADKEKMRSLPYHLREACRRYMSCDDAGCPYRHANGT